jgi:hypothetical protein
MYSPDPASAPSFIALSRATPLAESYYTQSSHQFTECVSIYNNIYILYIQIANKKGFQPKRKYSFGEFVTVQVLYV